MKPQFHRECIKDRAGARENQRSHFLAQQVMKRVPGLRGAGIPSPHPLLLPSLQAPSLHWREILIPFIPSPDITGNDVLKEVMERAQPTDNLRKFLVLPSLVEIVSVDGFGQQDKQGHQEAQKQYGAQSDDKRHIPR